MCAIVCRWIIVTVILFLIILAVLIFVHELGHFLVAKWAGVRVDAFSIGFPPKIAKWKREGDDTEYSIGAIPFGGYVKIFGEDPDEESLTGPERERAFTGKPKLVQILMLAAGVIFNWLFALILISAGFMIGLPTSTASFDRSLVENPQVVVLSTVPESPAEEAGLRAGDAIIAVSRGTETLSWNTPPLESLRDFIGRSREPIVFMVLRGQDSLSLTVAPEQGIIEDAYAVGISFDEIGTVSLPVHKALWEGGRATISLTKGTAVGLWNLMVGAFRGDADLSQVAGPVGLVNFVGSAASLGFVYLLSFTALISINLAIINLVPFPALDGGRILFVIIEGLKGSPIKPRVANTLNTVGFALLILLMAVITYNDIVRLF